MFACGGCWLDAGVMACLSVWLCVPNGLGKLCAGAVQWASARAVLHPTWRAICVITRMVLARVQFAEGLGAGCVL